MSVISNVVWRTTEEVKWQNEFCESPKQLSVLKLDIRPWISQKVALGSYQKWSLVFVLILLIVFERQNVLLYFSY